MKVTLKLNVNVAKSQLTVNLSAKYVNEHYKGREKEKFLYDAFLQHDTLKLLFDIA